MGNEMSTVASGKQPIRYLYDDFKDAYTPVFSITDATRPTKQVDIYALVLSKSDPCKVLEDASKVLGDHPTKPCVDCPLDYSLPQDPVVELTTNEPVKLGKNELLEPLLHKKQLLTIDDISVIKSLSKYCLSIYPMPKGKTVTDFYKYLESRLSNEHLPTVYEWLNSINPILGLNITDTSVPLKPVCYNDIAVERELFNSMQPADNNKFRPLLNIIEPSTHFLKNQKKHNDINCPIMDSPCAIDKSICRNYLHAQMNSTTERMSIIRQKILKLGYTPSEDSEEFFLRFSWRFPRLSSSTNELEFVARSFGINLTFTEEKNIPCTCTLSK